MKKWLNFGIIFLFVGMLLTACGGQQTGNTSKSTTEENKGEETKTPEVYKIGAIYSKTGPASPLGEPEWNATLLLEEQINANGGINGVPVKVILADDESKQEKAIEEMNRLIHDEKVNIILGTSTTGPSLAMKGLAMENQIPMISAAAATSVVAPVEESTWVFKTPHSDLHAVTRIYQYMKQEGITKIATLTDSNAYGAAGLEVLKELSGENGIEIVTSESYNTNDTDMSAQLTKINSSGAEALVVWGTNPGPAIIAKNMKELSMTMPHISSHGIANNTFIELAEGGAEGVVIPTGKLLFPTQIEESDPQYEVIKNFYDAYHSKFGGEPTQFGSYGYDNMLLAIEALKNAGTDHQAIRDYLETKVQSFVGATGTFTFSSEDHNGLSADSMVLAEVKDGKWMLKK
ncbi:ABC transporter substrate-binding protein [Schinkia azotoformans]|uniref:ABC transporter substrate-binding protein n=1 Tax=Schinkia azotoformans TaxID=1454 RepID=UPI002DBDBD44|nr:ABC transporter substrate-binding protein [Schinkia azotoformans]MEC1770469.1 ABC transporter substrate-binding protein [Schinkia azotoformans]MED4366646.1 ABC transporter substrate-binding protein [Schinkia azotoformans]